MLDMIDQFLTELRNIDVGVPLLGSLIAGALIGWEREVQRKSAGLRTHTLVCFTAALLTLLGLRMDEWHADLPASAQIVSDMSRMPHAVITGIGFLGAGVIFKDGFNVQGLTTAATLWLTAAIGVVLGTGLIGLAILATVIALMVLVVLRYLSDKWEGSETANLEVAVAFNSDLTKDEIIAKLSGHDLNAQLLTMSGSRQEGSRVYQLSLSTRRGAVPAEFICAQLLKNPDVLRVELAN